MKYKIGDQVQVTAGKDKGKTGEITRVFPQVAKVHVKGVNLYKRHLKSREGVEGGIFSLERPLPVANVTLICPTCKKTTRIGFQFQKSGTKIRICKKCSAQIILPKKATKKTKTHK